MRAALWAGLAALAAAAHWFDSDWLRGLFALAAATLLCVFSPRRLRMTLVVFVALAVLIFALSGLAGLLDFLPALIAALIAWIFARTLWRGRTPLIERAIATIDGPEQLADPDVRRYARRLTQIWAGYQTALALLAAALALRAQAEILPLADWLPGPRLFGALVLPAAVAGLFLGEFALRPLLLPRAPKHGLFRFVRELIVAWPNLLDER